MSAVEHLTKAFSTNLWNILADMLINKLPLYLQILLIQSIVLVPGKALGKQCHFIDSKVPFFHFFKDIDFGSTRSAYEMKFVVVKNVYYRGAQ